MRATQASDTNKLEVTPEMRDVAKRYTDDLLEVAKFNRHGAQISAVNLETYGVMRQLINTALGEDSDFGGRILDKEQIDKVRQTLADIDTSTWNNKAKNNLTKFTSEFDKAAKYYSKEPLVIFILIPDAITEEAIHGAFYQTVTENTIEKWQSPGFVKDVLDSPLYKATTVDENCGEQTEVVRAHKFIAKLLGGKWIDLGIDPDAHKAEILQTLRDWKDDYEKIHGKFDETVFRNASDMAEYFFAAAEEGFATSSNKSDKPQTSR